VNNIMTIPMMLTLARIVMIPVFIVAFYFPVEWSNILTVVIFFIATITDWFDGYLARKWNQESALGAFLDPVADKLIVAVALILLVQQGHDVHGNIYIAMASVVIIGREITISALREWMAEVGKGTSVSVSWLGKAKTFVQMWSIGFMLYHDELAGIDIYLVGLAGLYVAVVLTVWSMVTYLKTSWRSMVDA
jgi:CDP-diacylglycerol--glycerol-3-phosphate 3-phosphatidyltransferase